MKIYLVGFMACGKTTIGRLLAQRLKWPFIDMDERIETEQKTSIAQIFDTLGEPKFRRIEARLIGAAAAAPNSAVVALGGGAFVETANFEVVEASGVSVWLDCPFALVRRRVRQNSDRPLARDPERFQQLFESRRELYSRARFRVPVGNDDPERAVDAILQLPILHEA